MKSHNNYRVSLVIVNWNTKEMLLKQIETFSTSFTVQVIIIDNSESPFHKIPKAKNFTYIHNKLNKGYASACNQGLSYVEADWVLFLNPDVEVSPEAVNELVEKAEAKKYDACSPEPDSGYKKPLPTLISLLAEFTPLRFFIPLAIFPYRTLFGGCLLIKTDVIKKLEGWDERFFIWFEDADLTRRLLSTYHNVGWVTLPITHKGGASFEKLSSPIKRSLFFNALNIYSHKHFSFLSNFIIGMLCKNFTEDKLIPTRQPGISLIIPNMHYDILERFLQLNHVTLDTLAEVIIVSSSLSEERLWQIRKQYPHCLFIPIHENKGFTTTVNIGFRRATGAYIGTANDDTELNEKFFKAVTKYLQNDHLIGSANPVICKPDGSIESAGIDILPKGKALPRQSTLDTHTDATNGACVIYNREALQKVGIFDEKFGSYLEDIDLSLRLSRNGFKNIVLLEESIIHEGQKTSRKLGVKKQYMDFRNWLYVIAKNWSISTIVLNSGPILLERFRNISGIIKAL